VFTSALFYHQAGSTWRTLSCWTRPGRPAAPPPRPWSITPRHRCTWRSRPTCSTRRASSCWPGGPTPRSPGRASGPIPAAGIRCPASRSPTACAAGCETNSASTRLNSSWFCPDSAIRRGWTTACWRTRSARSTWPTPTRRPRLTRPRSPRPGGWTGTSSAPRSGPGSSPSRRGAPCSSTSSARSVPNRWPGRPPTRRTCRRPPSGPSYPQATIDSSPV